jgi:hypothetical protein
MSTPPTHVHTIASDVLRFNIGNVAALDDERPLTKADLVDEAVCVLRTGCDTDDFSCAHDDDLNVLLYVSEFRLDDNDMSPDEFANLLSQRTDTMRVLLASEAPTEEGNYYVFKIVPL